MNFIAQESAQKLRGGFYTDPLIAAFLTKWVMNSRPRTILEPSCGDGVFLEAIAERKGARLASVTACEQDSDEAAKARSRTALPVRMLNTDFLRWYLFKGQNEDGFDGALGNPPFIRYQYLPKEQQLLAEKIFGQLHLRFTKHTNAWVPFVVASLRLLHAGGRLAMVIPSEILHIPHAQGLRQFLAASCSRVLLLDPQEILFGNTLQGTVLILAEKKRDPSERSQGVAVIPIANATDLTADPEGLFSGASYTNGDTIEGKWMSVFLSAGERRLLASSRQNPQIRRFADVATVDVGIVTGANKFFLVPDSTVNDFGLEPWAHPMFGRSEHAKGLIFSNADYAENRRNGLPSNFLWFQEDDREDFPAGVQEYLQLGEQQDLHRRFKCRVRTPWYRVPSVHTTPVAMLKRAHNYPRLILNKAAAYTTDTAYRIRPIGVDAKALVFAFVNSLTCLTAELEGRHYGGGVIELVPSEIERLLVPVIDAKASELTEADRRFRESVDDVEFLKTQDARVFGQLGFSRSEQDILHSAWLRLRNRRHRLPASDEDSGEEPQVTAAIPARSR
jgi:adenine-specific DNA methylase